MYKKFLFGAILSAAVCMSACKKETELIDDFTATDARTEVNYVTEQSVTKAGRTDGTPEIVINPEGVNGYETDAEEKKVISLRQYYEERGFKDFYAPYRGYESYGLTLDLNDFKDGDDPFEGIDREHIETIDYLTLENIDGRDLNFLLRFEENYVDITVADYSGSADFGFYPQINANITFDNYMGGDLSTVKCSEQSYNVWFENYSGEYPLNGLPKDNVHNFAFENFADGVDFSFIAEYPNVTNIRLEGRGTKNLALDFIGDCKSLKNISVKGNSINAEAWAEVLKNTDLRGLYVEVEEYSSDEADILMKAAPTRSISYNLDDTPWLGYDGVPTEGVVFCANLYVHPDSEEKQWECKTAPAYPCSPKIWLYHGSLVSTFTNFTERSQKINSVKILKNDGGVLTEMPFADGSTLHEIDFTAAPESNSDFDITEEIFPFSKCETGIYKAVFDWDGTQLEQQFVINNETEDFFNEEQLEAYNEAYTEAVNNFGDRGSDISVQGNFFMPIYSDENEVLFKNFVIHGHEDYPYYIWFEEINYHMVKTDEGWRFDKFSLWY